MSIINISYVRVSTNGDNQISAIGKQYKMLKEICGDNIFVCVQSGALEFSDKFKQYVLDKKGIDNLIQLNVVAFDRLTRNFTDLDFIVKHIEKIFVAQENKTYCVKTDLQNIASAVGLSVAEHKLITERFKRYYAIKKRERIDDDIEMKMYNMKRRCIYASKNLEYYGISSEIIENIQKFITVSQNINSIQTWKEFINAGKTLNITDLAHEYEDYLKIYKSKKHPEYNKIFKISAHNLKRYIMTIIDQKIFVDKIVNAYVSYNNIKD